MTTNDVHSESFVSKLDEYFTSKVQSDRWGRYQRFDKDGMRSLLATTKPISRRNTRLWATAELGVSSPVRKNV